MAGTLPKWFIFHPQLSGNAICQQKRLLSPTLLPPPCFTRNIFLNHLRGKTHRFVRRCRRFIVLLPQCGAGAFIHLSAPPCLSPFQPSSPPPWSARFPRHLAPTSEGLSEGARALDQICVKYAYKVGWKGQAARPLACRTPACVLEGEGDAMIYIYVQYWRHFDVF